jgi:hypothetical protein
LFLDEYAKLFNQVFLNLVRPGKRFSVSASRERV